MSNVFYIKPLTIAYFNSYKPPANTKPCLYNTLSSGFTSFFYFNGYGGYAFNSKALLVKYHLKNKTKEQRFVQNAAPLLVI